MTHDLLQRDVALDALNTLRLPARAAWFAAVHDVDQLRAILEDPRIQGLPRLVLGGGSNLVLAGDFDGLVLQVAFKGRSRVQEDADAWYIRAGGGENWHDFVRWTLEMGWAGLENLSLIPGTVGAAPVQNIGAYGLELAEHFYSLRAYDLETGKTVGFDKADCHFAYRDSFFKRHPGRYLIGAVTFRLPKTWRPVTAYADVAKALAAEGIAIIFISHRLREVVELCDRVVVLKEGEIVRQGTPAHVFMHAAKLNEIRSNETESRPDSFKSLKWGRLEPETKVINEGFH